jgi:hypothetical protein
MWRSRTTLAASALALAFVLSAALPASAFQEIPVPPPEPSGEAAPDALPPALDLGTPRSALDTKADSGGVEVFGYHLMPKLDFGLEFLYGQDPQILELQQNLNSFDADSDITVLGKVKRRF